MEKPDMGVLTEPSKRSLVLKKQNIFHLIISVNRVVYVMFKFQFQKVNKKWSKDISTTTLQIFFSLTIEDVLF